MYENPALKDRPDGMEPVAERRDHPEIAATSPQPPEQVGVLRLARDDGPPVRGDDFGGHQVVATEPVLGRQPALTPAEGQTTDPGVGHPTSGRGQQVLLRSGIDVQPGTSAACRRDSGLGVDRDVAHPGEVDDHAVAQRRTSDPVSAALHRHAQAGFSGDA